MDRYIKIEEVKKQLNNMIRPLINKWKGKEIKINLSYRNMKEENYKEEKITFDNIIFNEKDLHIVVVSKSNLDWEVGWDLHEIVEEEFVQDFKPFEWFVDEDNLITINIGY